MTEDMKKIESLDFTIDDGDPRVLTFKNGGCYPASREEIAMWDMLRALPASGEAVAWQYQDDDGTWVTCGNPDKWHEQTKKYWGHLPTRKLYAQPQAGQPVNVEAQAAIAETLSYFDDEFPLSKYPDREEMLVSSHAGGLTVRQLRNLLAVTPPAAAQVPNDEAKTGPHGLFLHERIWDDETEIEYAKISIKQYDKLVQLARAALSSATLDRVQPASDVRGDLVKVQDYIGRNGDRGKIITRKEAFEILTRLIGPDNDAQVK